MNFVKNFVAFVKILLKMNGNVVKTVKEIIKLLEKVEIVKTATKNHLKCCKKLSKIL